MIAGRETFQKAERLCSRKIITGLFETGNTLFTPLFKVIWSPLQLKEPVPAQVSFSVAKRNFRHAVERNLLKRRMKEAYRKNKEPLYDFLNPQKIQIAFIVIYRENSIKDSRMITESMQEMLKKLISRIREKGN